MNNKKTELLGNAPIPKALLAMGIPTMIGMLVNAFYNLVDAYFVSGLSESQMGVISIVYLAGRSSPTRRVCFTVCPWVYPLGQIIVGLGLLFGNGAASYISRLLGHGDAKNADKVASTAIYSSIFVSAVIIIIFTIFLHPILTLLGATDSILPYASTYASIYIISSIFNVFNVTMNNIVTSEGAASLRANGITMMLFGFHTVYSPCSWLWEKAEDLSLVRADKAYALFLSFYFFQIYGGERNYLCSADCGSTDCHHYHLYGSIAS